MLRSAERLRILRRLLRSDEDLGLLTSQRAVFFERDGSWHSTQSQTVNAAFWLKLFRYALRKPGFHKAADTVVWGFRDLSAVVAVRLLPEAIEESGRVDRVVRRLIEQMEDKFAADFDKLTNAPNRRQLERRLDQIAKSVAEFSATPNDGWRAVVMMLDLDNFKQANDSAGHDFGDALLQVTAWRLRDAAEKWIRDGVAKDVCAGRWGGEEFLVGGLFQSDAATIARHADALVRCFADPPMPDGEKEVPKLRKLTQNPTANFNPPKPAVTASLGWSMMDVAAEAMEIPKVVQEVIVRADTAMYRAKSIGKNRAVSFDDIVTKHGRILLHRIDAGIVVLDIGEFVGVKQGDKFDVYPEDFANRRDYLHSDGRTERALGRYPLLPVARLRVETTPERDIAFCSIVRLRQGAGQLSERAHLQLIPTEKAARAKSTQAPETDPLPLRE